MSKLRREISGRDIGGGMVGIVGSLCKPIRIRRTVKEISVALLGHTGRLET
jgi:hypothetical protein